MLNDPTGHNPAFVWGERALLCALSDSHIAALTHFSHDQGWVEHGESETSHKSCVQAQHQEDGLLGLSVTERTSAL